MSYLETARQVIAELHGKDTATKATEATEAPLLSLMSLMSQPSADKKRQISGVENELQAKCKTACEGLPIAPTELFDAMTDADRRANPSPETLRAFAESLAERLPKALSPGISRAYDRLRHTLAKNPGLKFACETLPDKGGDYVLMAVAVKGAGFAVLRMPRGKFDGFKLLELSCRWNHGSKP